MAKQDTSTSLNRLISESLAMEAAAAKEAGALGFMARALVQATLPHSKTAGNEFTRTNGAFTLNLLAPSDIGLPYGSMPRLILAWLSTEAVRTQQRELVLGDSLSAFMRELGLHTTGGQRGYIKPFKEQLRRLFSSTIRCTYAEKYGEGGMGYSIADNYMLWWHPKSAEQTALWQSTVHLSEPFYREVTEHPVPIDMRALKALKKSPLALDLYCWLTYRMSYLHTPTSIPWAALQSQFGADYKVLRQFKAAFLRELKKVLVVYPEAKVLAVEAGESGGALMLSPSKTHIKK